MKRLLVAAVSAACLLVGAGPALADVGAPGATFPEEPGGNVAMACATVTSGIQVGGGATNNPLSDSITAGLVEDACFGE